ncbi:MAG: neuromedin U, partial [Acidobacteria bacterium]|nr:neuromedin U [Acidobacteriota bacterium]
MDHILRVRRLLPALLMILLLVVPITAQENTPSSPDKQTAAEQGAEASLEKAVQNPVASLISVPLQNNTNFGYGPYNRTQDVLNIQPVIPMQISRDWMVITRIIQPIVWQPYPSLNTGGQYGLGDMVPTFFLSPREPKKVIWGFGPAFTIPTATNDILGQGKLSLGPSFVAL